MRARLLIATAVVALSACAAAMSAEPTPVLDPLAASGKEIFTRHCAACHALSPDTILVGPSLAGLADRAEARVPALDARHYIEQSILNPETYVVKGFSDVMPKDFGVRLSGEDLDALLAFLLTLK